VKGSKCGCHPLNAGDLVGLPYVPPVPTPMFHTILNRQISLLKYSDQPR